MSGSSDSTFQDEVSQYQDIGYALIFSLSCCKSRSAVIGHSSQALGAYTATLEDFLMLIHVTY